MGLRMDDIHTPSSMPAGPVSINGQTDSLCNGKQSLADLIAQKERIESEMTALSSVLDSVRSLEKKSCSTYSDTNSKR